MFYCVGTFFFFFFSSRRRHTRLQGDWSSDVCSSDLELLRRAAGAMQFRRRARLRIRLRASADPHAKEKSESAIVKRYSPVDLAVANREYNVLFLCTSNSARSIMAECAINRWGKGKFKGFSAGRHPKGAALPMTLALLQELNYDTSSLRSKSWDEFARADSPP